MKKLNWKKYSFEFLSIFIAVVSAFALNNWNDKRNNTQSERNILREIRNSIDSDLGDFETNIFGNNRSLRANEIFTHLVQNQSVPNDSIAYYYTILFRDYVPIVNKSAYESYKANNIKIITNDSLRLQIISLYDYHYTIIEVLEYEVPEMMSYANYFSDSNEILAPYMEFDDQGNLITISPLKNLKADEKKKLLSYLWRIKNNRHFKLGRYKRIIEAMKKVSQNITRELETKHR